jgi:hypothetical protein
MTVREFCRTKTKTHQLCIICDSGWIVETVWIDSEDLFRLSTSTANCEVQSTDFDELPIVTEHGDTIRVPCLRINII